MLKPRVIGLNGAPGCGKSTAARHIQNAFRDVVKTSLAAPLMEAYLILSGVTLEQYQQEKELHRSKIISLSEGWAKTAFGRKHWVELLYTEISHEANREFIWIIDDVGFPQEESFLREHTYFTLIHISRPGTSLENDSRHNLAYCSDFHVHNRGPLDLFLTVTEQLFESIAGNRECLARKSSYSKGTTPV